MDNTISNYFKWDDEFNNSKSDNKFNIGFGIREF